MTILKDTPAGTLDRVDDLADQCADIIKQEARRLLLSGGVDPTENADRPYWLPKLLVSVACEHAASQWENPVDPTWTDARKNLRHF